ncbi:protein FAM222B-like [Scleropages formosus]|uniref:protein FAM222B-like n=1 Tax=Scleropages formosus TaxID=113540 RepID=UPI00087850BA|nr:protein FAM222B-like [Scleropages formosus]XP_018614323.1 protein FAM222B-like [Scleropages formosus]
MLACLPVPGDLPFQLLSHLQMNTGLQKWDSTRKMRSAQYPTPAELDAYAKKVAHSPLTIKIFPNSVKVPQKKHVRRTVNGLDTSSHRYCPYPSQASAKAGLLSVVKMPIKGVIKDMHGSRVHQFPEATMNHHNGSYFPQSTLNVPQTTPQSQGPLQPQHIAQQQNLNHVQALAQQKPRSQPCLQTVSRQQVGPQGLRHLPSSTQPLSMQHHQALPPVQTVPYPLSLQPTPANMMLHNLEQTHTNLHWTRNMPGTEAPPNVTVSTSTIPLPMAAGLHHNRPADLSSIVHQINQFCQTRARIGTTSLCEGQIANPSPINRNLLISTSSRALSHHSAPGAPPMCVLGSAHKAAAPIPVGALPPLDIATVNPMHMLRGDGKTQQQSWSQQHGMLQQNISEAEHLGKPALLDPPGGPAFPNNSTGYPLDMSLGQPFNLKLPMDKPTPSPPVIGVPAAISYTNGPYLKPLWNGVLPTPNSDSSGSQDLALHFHGGPLGAQVDCTPASIQRPGASSSGHTNPRQAMEYMAGDFHAACFKDQSFGNRGKIQRPAIVRGPETGSSRNPQMQHPGYR